MKVTVLHDEHGQIIAISNVGDLGKAGSKFDTAGILPQPGQQKLEIELSGDDETRPLLDFHKAYRVDLATSQLVKKD